MTQRSLPEVRGRVNPAKIMKTENHKTYGIYKVKKDS